MCGRVLLPLISLIIALLAVFLALPLEEYPELFQYQESVKQILEPVTSLLNTCPMHWFKEPSEDSKRYILPDGTYSVVRPEQYRLFTKEELAKYDGSEGSLGLYLAVLGLVYDVSSGSRFYEPGGGYSFFAGRDGTKAFMTGDFTPEGLVDETTGLSPAQMLELEDWIKFYDETYVFVGKVIGNFYDSTGAPKEALYEAKKGIDVGHAEKRQSDTLKKAFPHCNSQWAQDVGGSVWCSEESGGDKRDWVGVPRKFYQPGMSRHRCACVRTEGPPFDKPDSNSNRGDLDYPGLELYEDCPPESHTCRLLPDKD